MNQRLCFLVSVFCLFSCESSPLFRPTETAKLVDKIWRVESYTKEFHNTDHALRVDRKDVFVYEPLDQTPGHFTRTSFNETTEAYDTLSDTGAEIRLEFLLNASAGSGEAGDFFLYRFYGENADRQFCRPDPLQVNPNRERGDWAWKDTERPIMEVPPMAEVFLQFQGMEDVGNFDKYPGHTDYEFTLLTEDRFVVEQRYVVGRYEIIKRAECIPISCEERDESEPGEILAAWTELEEIPNMLANAVSLVSEGEVFLMSGTIGEDAQLYCYAYHIESDTWTQKADVPGAARSRAVGFTFDKSLFIGGGINAQSIEPFQDFWMFNQLEDVWTPIADFPGEARFDAVGFAIGNKGYVGAGKNWLGQLLKDFWEYDLLTNQWKQIPDLPGPERSEAVGFSIGNLGYVGLGLGSSTSNLQDFWVFDPATEEWTAGPVWPNSGRVKAGVMTLADRVFICGGREVHSSGSTFHKDLWEYVPSDNIWNKKSDFPGSESYDFIGGGDLDGGLGLLGGQSGAFWKYSPDDD
ncbi:MAG: kelch repeat-containing protein [Bacteroidota bacterium]